MVQDLFLGGEDMASCLRRPCQALESIDVQASPVKTPNRPEAGAVILWKHSCLVEIFISVTENRKITVSFRYREEE